MNFLAEDGETVDQGQSVLFAITPANPADRAYQGLTNCAAYLAFRTAKGSKTLKV